MKAVTVFLVFVFPFTQGAFGISNDIPNRVNSWLSHPNEMDSSTMSVIEQQQVISELRSAAEKTSWTGERSTAKKLLVRIGDEQTIADAIEGLHGKGQNWDNFHEAYQALSWSRQPAVIPLMIPDLQDPSEVMQRGGELAVGPPHNVAAFIIMEIIKTSPQLGERIVAPLREKGFTGMPQMRASLLNWWGQNKDAFARKDYAAVQPLEPVSLPEPPRATTNQTSTAPPAPGVPTKPVTTNQAATPSPTGVTMTVAAPPVSTPSPTDEPTTRNWKAVAIIVIVVLAVVGFIAAYVLKRRSNKP